MKAFKNSLILTKEGFKKTCLVYENGKIISIGDESLLAKCDEVVELEEGKMLVPGFIDQHIHGAAGSDAMDGTKEDLLKISNALAKEGTVAYLATTMTQSEKNITKALNAVKEYKQENISEGAEILGVHLEGPFISEKFIGAQPLEYVHKPDITYFKRLEEASGNNIKLVSLAPEVEGALEFIEYLVSKNIVASCGHTSSNYDDIEKAVKVGLSNATHTYNAMKPIHHREIGTVGAAYSLDELNCEVICDGIHVSGPAIKLLYKNKPIRKFTLITDAMRAKHMPDGISELGGQVVIVKNGEARLENGTLAGSVLRMNVAVRNVKNFLGVSLEEAISFATLNPALNLGVADKLGTLEEGKLASFVVIDEDVNVYTTYREGKVIFQN